MLPVQPVSTVRGGGSLMGALVNNGTLTLEDSLTYTAVADVGTAVPISNLVLRSVNRSRPVIRIDGGEWRFTGAQNPAGELTLEGLFISGFDLVLSGDFDQVTLRCCTFDPGVASSDTIFAPAVDGRDLRPSCIWIEGQVRSLRIERCVTAQIRTRSGGAVEHLYAADTMMQAIRTSGLGDFASGELKDAQRLIYKLKYRRDTISTALFAHLSAPTQADIDALAPNTFAPSALIDQVVADFNTLIHAGASLDDPAWNIHRSARTQALLQALADGTALSAAEMLELNRRLLEDAYPEELADAVLVFSAGLTELERCTLFDVAYLHRLEASECILNDWITVEDSQGGCVRFSAWADGSVLPRRYESVRIMPHAALFESRVFGDPHYAQLLSSADAAIIAPSPHDTIRRGAQNGSEMGALASEIYPIKEDSLLIKLNEYMPVQLVPVLINVT